MGHHPGAGSQTWVFSKKQFLLTNMDPSLQLLKGLVLVYVQYLSFGGMYSVATQRQRSQISKRDIIFICKNMGCYPSSGHKGQEDGRHTVRVTASIFDCSLLMCVRSRACSQDKKMSWRTTAKSGSHVFGSSLQVSDSFVCYVCGFVLTSRPHYNLIFFLYFL